MTPFLPTGKLDLTLLGRVLAHLNPKGFPPEVLVPPKPGEDAAALDLGDRALVVASDPITFVTQDLGFYLVTINANDVAVMGARPRYLLVTLLLPEGTTTAEQVEAWFRQIGEAAAEMGVTVIGGHTEVTYELDRPLAIGTMLGFVEKENLVTSGGARPGDRILLTKGIAIEGTSIIAKELTSRIEPLFEPGTLEEIRNWHRKISVVEEALLAVEAGPPTAMHDPTEGGLGQALHELAEASGVGVLVRERDIPILPETRVVCTALGLDPLGLIASGALLITAPPERAERIARAIGEKGIPVQEIGEIQPPDFGLRLVKSSGVEVPLPAFAQDELVKVL